MAKSPNKRIWTQRYPDGKSYEAIEVTPTGHLMWIASDHTADGIEVGAAFPVDIDFVANKFAESGRQFDASKLPANVITDPYAIWRGGQ